MDAPKRVSEQQPVAAHLERNQALRVESVHGAACELGGLTARIINRTELGSVHGKYEGRAPTTGSSAGDHTGTAASACGQQRQLWPGLTRSAHWHCIAHSGRGMPFQPLLPALAQAGLTASAQAGLTASPSKASTRGCPASMSRGAGIGTPAGNCIEAAKCRSFKRPDASHSEPASLLQTQWPSAALKLG